MCPPDLFEKLRRSIKIDLGALFERLRDFCLLSSSEILSNVISERENDRLQNRFSFQLILFYKFEKTWSFYEKGPNN